MKNNKGITLVELIVVIVLMFMVIPLFWNNIQSAFDDSVSVTEKTAVQSSVNSLMSRMQLDTQEASIAVADSNGFEDTENGNIVILKPGENQNVSYTYHKSQQKVTYKAKVKADGSEVTGVTETMDYDYITFFKVKKVDKGLEIRIRGELDNTKTKYELSNTFYTRNTI